MKITMIGHSTVLIETGQTRLITDPFFNRWGNPAIGRIRPPACAWQDLPRVDGVLLSHDHWDHVCPGYFRSLGQVPVCVPRISSNVFRWMGVGNRVEMDAWESTTIRGIKITAVPAVHLTFSLGYVVEADGQCIYFAGDTYYRPFMAEIAGHFTLDAALIPIIGFRVPMTMNERQAVHAAHDLQPKVVIPIHLDLSPRLSWLRTGDSVEGFSQRMAERMPSTRVVHLKPGDEYTLE